jgi:uncharacterized protein YdeI (YjbR/CyaY-like superfamily)
MKDEKVKPTFFKTPAAFRKWLEANHAAVRELWVGYYKRGSGKPSLTWPESVDQALCFGWIDGIRKSVDDTSYVIRFTPRKKSSVWSAVNIKRVEQLMADGLVHAAGLKAFQERKEHRSRIYSYEQKELALDGPLGKRLRQNRAAWTFFQAQPPWYRRTAGWWIISARKEETRLRRLEKLIACSESGEPIPALARKKKVE